MVNESTKMQMSTDFRCNLIHFVKLIQSMGGWKRRKHSCFMLSILQ